MEVTVVKLGREESQNDNLMGTIDEKDIEISHLARMVALTWKHELEKVLSDESIVQFDSKLLTKYANEYFSEEMPWLEIDEETISHYIEIRKKVLSNDKD